MKVDSTEISEYIEGVLKGIKQGIGSEFIITDTITLELAVVNEAKGEIGGAAEVKVHVFGVDGKVSGSVSNEQVSKITIPIRFKQESVAPRATMRSRR